MELSNLIFKFKDLENSVDWIDYDKDGDLDLFLTGLDDNGLAKAMLYKADNTNNLNTPLSKITNLTATADEFGTVEFKWDKPTDNSSSEFSTVLKLELVRTKMRIRQPMVNFPNNIIYSNSNAETGSTLINIPSLSTQNSRQVILNPGTYYAAVQAIDGGNMGGPFSDTVSITLDYEWKLLNLGGIIDRRLIPSASTHSISWIWMEMEIRFDSNKSRTGAKQRKGVMMCNNKQ